MSSARVTSTATVFITGLLAWALSRWVLRLFSTTGSSTEIARSFASAIGEMFPEAPPRSYECPECTRTFTVFPVHKSCPVCAVPTRDSERLPIYDPKRAASLVHLQEAFRSFYLRRADHRGKLGYADPDAIGARQAREEAKVMRGLEEAMEDEDV